MQFKFQLKLGEYKTVFNLHKCDIDFLILVLDSLEYISNKLLESIPIAISQQLNQI